MKRIFEINEIEMKRYENWLKKLPKKYQKLETEFVFQTGSGIGVAILARKGTKEVDLTDYSTW